MILPDVLVEGHGQEIGRQLFFRSTGNVGGEGGAADRKRSTRRDEPLQWDSCGQVECGARNHAQHTPPRTKDFSCVPCARYGPCPTSNTF